MAHPREPTSSSAAPRPGSAGSRRSILTPPGSWDVAPSGVRFGAPPPSSLPELLQLERDVSEDTLGRRREASRRLVQGLGGTLDQLVNRMLFGGRSETASGHREALSRGAELDVTRPSHGRKAGRFHPGEECLRTAVQLRRERTSLRSG
jgi:hypothetical protein